MELFLSWTSLLAKGTSEAFMTSSTGAQASTITVLSSLDLNPCQKPVQVLRQAGQLQTQLADVNTAEYICQAYPCLTQGPPEEEQSTSKAQVGFWSLDPFIQL